MAKSNKVAARSTGAVAPQAGSVLSLTPEMLAQLNELIAAKQAMNPHVSAAAATVTTVTAADGTPVELASRSMTDSEVRQMAESFFSGRQVMAKVARALHYGEATPSQVWTYFFAGRSDEEVKHAVQSFNMAIRRVTDNKMSFKADKKNRTVLIYVTKSRTPRVTGPELGSTNTPAKAGDEPDVPVSEAGRASAPASAPAAPASPDAVADRVVSNAKTMLSALPAADRKTAAVKLARELAAMLASLGELEAGRDVLKAADAPAAPAKSSRKK